MHPSAFPQLSFLLLLLLHLLSILHQTVITSGCPAVERDALLALKAGLNDTRNRLSSWEGQDCCRWAGVVCDNNTRHVAKLILRNAHTRSYCLGDNDDCSDYIDDNWAFHGERINSSLLALTELQHLDLSHNDFTGIRIPKFIGSFDKLTYLNLSSTNFTGGIPAQLGNLSRLHVLDLSGALWSGNYRIDDLGWLSRLSSLKHLDLSELDLENVTDWFRSVNMLGSLKALHMAFCGLNSIPISPIVLNFTSLAILDLSFNFISSLPEWLGNVTGLSYLDLNSALWGGGNYRIDDLGWLSRLSSLKHLDLSGLDLKNVTDWFRSVNMLGSLKALHMVNCGLNSIPVSPIELNFTSLAILDLSSNIFNSSLPEWLGNVTGLTSLHLSDCEFRGTIPDAIGDLISLTFLDLGENGNLVGTVPKSMANLRRLKALRLRDNQLTGNLTDWLEQMTSLTILDLRYNSFNGSIPPSIGKLANLTALLLEGNSFGGVISEVHFENLTRLEWLLLSGNSLAMSVHHSWVPPFQLKNIDLCSCQIGPRLPKWLKFQTRIEVLDLCDNQIAGTLPDWFWNISSSTIQYLDLSNNQIEGKLPTSLEFMKLSDLILDSNLFGGPLPTYLPSTLSYLSLSNNSFIGQLPKYPHVTSLLLSHNILDGGISLSICGSMNLSYLDLSNNNFSGQIPHCLGESLKRLSSLNLANNNFFGEIPSTIGPLTRLYDLHLNNNSLSGQLPLSLQNCSNLVFLDLAQNKFNGSISSWIGESFHLLVVLRLRSNMFSGDIPCQFARLQSLRILDIGDNKFSGSIPNCFDNFSGMSSTSKFFYFEINSISFDVFIKGLDLYYLYNLHLVKSLDLSRNNLIGKIPEGIGNLTGLNNLNLSRNHLSGKIPQQIGEIKLLESLDLSMNELSGSIPQSLSTLTFLSYLNLSYNNLSGKIPSGHQLQTLNDPSIYMGNPNLCGPPTSNNCSSNKTIQSGEQTHKVTSFEWIWLYIGMMMGFVMGFWTFCGVLLLKSAWRHAYFYMIDNLCDRVLLQ